MKTIICHSFPAWDTPYIKSTVELMTRLANQNRVIFIDYHYTIKDLFKHPNAPKNQIKGKVSRWRKIETEHAIIEVYNALPLIPVNWINNQPLFTFIMTINAWIVSFSIKKILKKVNLNNTVLVNAFNPIYGWFTKKYWKGISSVYYSYDEIGGAEWAAKWGSIYEPKYAVTANAVVTTSTHLRAKFESIHSKVSVVKNGVNLSIFKETKIESIKHHKVGYIGAIDDRIDFALLRDLALALPNYSIELLGPVKKKIPSELPENLVLLGAHPQDSIPEIAKNWDACIIPFVKTQLTKAIYPLKINEYLAMGKPVVTTNFSDLSDFKRLVGIATSNQEFIASVKKELRSNNRIKIQKRIAFAMQNSWESRVELFLDKIIEVAK
ncbi:MAG: teichuronic acid biosynthesis glycosyltransferase TuaH [Roseivirga sp.]|jgi:teichuronic acid biosynthesis glycosyltransferase TuaH